MGVYKLLLQSRPINSEYCSVAICYIYLWLLCPPLVCMISFTNKLNVFQVQVLKSGHLLLSSKGMFGWQNCVLAWLDVYFPLSFTCYLLLPNEMFVLRTDVRKPPVHMSMNRDTLSFQWDNIINVELQAQKNSKTCRWSHNNYDNVNHTIYDGDFTNTMIINCIVVS